MRGKKGTNGIEVQKSHKWNGRSKKTQMEWKAKRHERNERKKTNKMGGKKTQIEWEVKKTQVERQVKKGTSGMKGKRYKWN